MVSDDVTDNEISVVRGTEIASVEPSPSQSTFSDMTMSATSTKRTLPVSGLEQSRKKLSFTDDALVRGNTSTNHTNSGIDVGGVCPAPGSSSVGCISSEGNNPERRR